jgi:hypothetical protein
MFVLEIVKITYSVLVFPENYESSALIGYVNNSRNNFVYGHAQI